MKRVTPLLTALLASVLVSTAALAATVRNADVIKLLEAGMPEEVVLQAIANGTPKFDTSTDALIALKAKGATPAILSAMLRPAGATAAPAASAGKQSAPSQQRKASNSGYNPEEVTLIVNGQPQIMSYIIPQTRTAARALGFGGMASYASLSGKAAQRRLASNTPEFIVSVPKNAQADNYLTLANFAVRNNDTREVMTGGGYMSYSSGINKSRVVKVTTTALPDQSGAREGFILYKITPEAPLKAGEYALVLYTGEMRTAGFFAQAANSYFDFGVD
ncbi:hypothetical protein [Massilia sp. CF038]|uniref:hypothetical protein n=1 Tax=Massilia sp. CF038 TaxID=1881045 RepID=UPI00091070DE|nr:hypothetical protein [Massilia sp. CF038]SHG68570.1 hypothetical protein SAMN05428948_1603 [Massilia sp. CF038]